MRWRNGAWRYSRFLPGHNLKKDVIGDRRHENRSTRSLEGVGGAAFVEKVRQRLLERGLSFDWLREQTGIHRESIFSRYRPRPETVARIASALDLDVRESMVDAGWPEPDAIALGILRLEAGGLSREEVAAKLTVSRQFIDNALRGQHGFHQPIWIRQVAPILELTEQEVDGEIARAREGHSGAMRAGAADRDPTVTEAHRQRLKAINKRRKADKSRKEALRSNDAGREIANDGRAEEAEGRIVAAHRAFHAREARWPSLRELAQEAGSHKRTVSSCVQKHSLPLKPWRKVVQA